MVGRSIADMYDQGAIFTETQSFKVNMNTRSYIGYGPTYHTTYNILYSECATDEPFAWRCFVKQCHFSQRSISHYIRPPNNSPQMPFWQGHHKLFATRLLDSSVAVVNTLHVSNISPMYVSDHACRNRKLQCLLACGHLCIFCACVWTVCTKYLLVYKSVLCIPK